ncbi:MAG: hypothetical protein ACKO3C_06150 [Betaproteobacteria bacterium]
MTSTNLMFSDSAQAGRDRTPSASDEGLRGPLPARMLKCLFLGFALALSAQALASSAGKEQSRVGLYLDLDDASIQQRAKEAAAAGVRITCTQPKGGGGAAYQEEVSRTYLIHKGLIWVLLPDGGGPAFPSYYSVSGGVLKWRNEAAEFAVRSSRPWHEIHLAKLLEFADSNRLTGPFPCKVERGSLQGL